MARGSVDGVLDAMLPNAHHAWGKFGFQGAEPIERGDEFL
jgi:hypothetical protein